MIMILYQLVCGYMVTLIVRGLLVQGDRREKAIMAMLFVPLALRLLLIK